MANPEWGEKHKCPNCSAKFYDLLKKPPFACPACQYVFDPMQQYAMYSSGDKEQANSDNAQENGNETTIAVEEDEGLLIDDDIDSLDDVEDVNNSPDEKEEH